MTLGLWTAAGADDTRRLPTAASSGMIDESMRREVDASVRRGLDWLLANRNDDGSWSRSTQPALTAIPLLVFGLSEHPDKEAVATTALPYLLASVQPDGGLYRSDAGDERRQLRVYNTALSMLALASFGDDAWRRTTTPIVRAARRYLADRQHRPLDQGYGGIGYDTVGGATNINLLSTMTVAEAMRGTERVDAGGGAPPVVDLSWPAVADYVRRCQVMTGNGAAGRFAYTPDRVGEDPGSVETNGVMTCAGLLTYLYAGVDSESPPVRAAVQWLADHASLAENPGREQRGIYYYYQLRAKALSAYGEDVVVAVDGRRSEWRVNLIKELLSRQRIAADGMGHWVNDTADWWEADPVLTTSYALLALQIASPREEP